MKKEASQFARYTLSLILLLLAAESKAQMCRTETRPVTISVPDYVPDNLITAQVVKGSKAYSTADQAAISAIQMIPRLKNFSFFEYSGCIYLDRKAQPQVYYSTFPVTNGSSSAFRISCVAPHVDAKLVGIYHTHPLSDDFGNQDGFSPHDIEIAKKLNVTSYVGTVKTRNIIRYISCKTRIECLDNEGIRCRRKFSRGEKIGSF